MKKETFYCDITGVQLSEHQPFELAVDRSLDAAGSAATQYDGFDDLSYAILVCAVKKYFKEKSYSSAQEFIGILREEKILNDVLKNK